MAGLEFYGSVLKGEASFDPKKNVSLPWGVGASEDSVLSLLGHAGGGVGCFYYAEKVQTRCGVVVRSLWL